MTGRPPALRLVASVGTDHHPFDRLVGWLDEIARDGLGGRRTEVWVQFGSSRPPVRAGGAAFVAHAELVDRLREADLVVVHGGPSTILDALRAGHRPVCVPRDPGRGEHVDDHQVRFADFLRARDVVDVVHDREALLAALGRDAVRDPRPATEEGDLRTAAAVARVARVAEELAAAPPRRRASLRTAALSARPRRRRR
ncbi:glycosyltransferase [Marmoricola sp. RAF53]|uniref:glycosyltransferase n=1 Tax=Marmoricola sp. RAF53 TaxID=3233059 RepID=UPI003F975E90